MGWLVYFGYKPRAFLSGGSFNTFPKEGLMESILFSNVNVSIIK